MQAALAALQESDEAVDSFTFFFAGHGGLSRGTYYLCPVDARQDRLSTTGFALSHLFEFINELGAAHCNLILDACNAGGLVSDIGALLKPEIIGKANTVGISIFASSAADQYASETSMGGFGTSALIGVLRGEIDTGSRSQYLDLLDIGRAASSAVSLETSGQQSPSIWGMNLYGAKPLFGNPHASGDHPSSLLAVTGIPPGSPAGIIIANNASTILGLMYAPPEDLVAARLFDTLQPRFPELATVPGACASFVDGVQRALQSKVREQQNCFAAAELACTCVALLLPTVTADAASADAIRSLSIGLVKEVQMALVDLTNDLAHDSSGLYFFGIPDLFYLPQRIARVLGWAEAAIYIARQFEISTGELDACLDHIYPLVLSTYGATLGGMSEAETPYWLISLVNLRLRGEIDIGEQILGTLFNALVQNGGALAKADLGPDKVIAYLIARAQNDFEGMVDFRAQPSEAFSMILLLGAAFSMQEVFDPELQRLDHVSMNIFLPNAHIDFASRTIYDGRNHVFQVGHGIWKVEDLVQRWEAACIPQLSQDSNLDSPEVRAAAICAALIFPDRVPWFLLRDLVLFEPSSTIFEVA